MLDRGRSAKKESEIAEDERGMKRRCRKQCRCTAAGWDDLFLDPLFSAGPRETRLAWGAASRASRVFVLASGAHAWEEKKKGLDSHQDNNLSETKASREDNALLMGRLMHCTLIRGALANVAPDRFINDG